MNPFIEIAGRKIGKDSPPLIICEIGINHGGSLDRAIAMVDAARSAGAEIIKHQTHIVDDEMSFDAKNIVPSNANISIYEIMSACALNENDEKKLRDYVINCNIIFISTPFSRQAVFRLEKFDVPAYKVGSGECNNLPLLRLIASMKKPIILSTGMNDLASVKRAVTIFRENNLPFALLHTTNLYPTPPDLVRLNALRVLEGHFPDAVIGLSDHTVSNHACFGAVALGASILERHFTDSMDRDGPDIINSMDTNAFKELKEGCELIANMRGEYSKNPLKEEKVTSSFAFASVVAIRDIKKNEVFTEQNIWVKRPGTGGIPAKDFEMVLGKRASADISVDSQVKISDILK